MSRPSNGLVSQSEAREQARALTEAGTPAVAVPVPLGSWGGTEEGWTVNLLPPDDQDERK